MEPLSDWFSHVASDTMFQLLNALICLPSGIAFFVGLVCGHALAF